MASERGKVELCDILCSGHLFTDVSPELLQHTPFFTRVYMSEPNNWQSAKEVLVKSFQISDIQRCVQGGFFRVKQTS
jgi:hypothetical protein